MAARWNRLHVAYVTSVSVITGSTACCTSLTNTFQVPVIPGVLSPTVNRIVWPTARFTSTARKSFSSRPRTNTGVEKKR